MRYFHQSSPTNSRFPDKSRPPRGCVLFLVGLTRPRWPKFRSPTKWKFHFPADLEISKSACIQTTTPSRLTPTATFGLCGRHAGTLANAGEKLNRPQVVLDGTNTLQFLSITPETPVGTSQFITSFWKLLSARLRQSNSKRITKTATSKTAN